MGKILSVFVFVGSMSAFAMETVSHSEHGTAQQKHNVIANKIIITNYFRGENTTLPQITGPGIKGLGLMCPMFIAKSFSNEGNKMEHDRAKLIHGFGTTIAVSFRAHPKNKLQLTGIFESGAKHGFLRLSLAEPPNNGNFKPGFAMALFRDNQASANIFAMPSLDGIENTNLFEQNFVTALPPPTPSIKMWVLENRFAAATETLGFQHANIRALTLDAVASHNEQGEAFFLTAPYSLIFRPTKAAKRLLEDATLDFRAALQGKGEGIVLFKVDAIMNEGDTITQRIGLVEATGPFIASSYGDEHLFFKHPSPHILKSE